MVSLQTKGGIQVSWTASIQSLLSSTLSDLGWSTSSHGLVGPSPNLSCQCGDDLKHLDAVLHRVRVAWRNRQILTWLGSETRRDAQIARALNINSGKDSGRGAGVGSAT